VKDRSFEKRDFLLFLSAATAKVITSWDYGQQDCGSGPKKFFQTGWRWMRHIGHAGNGKSARILVKPV
jgi:hypothetical protein